MASGSGRYAIGRFFVTTQADQEHGLKSGRSKHGGSKRVKKYGMPLSYPEPTIQEETSPNDPEVNIGMSQGEWGRAVQQGERLVFLFNFFSFRPGSGRVSHQRRHMSGHCRCTGVLTSVSRGGACVYIFAFPFVCE